MFSNFRSSVDEPKNVCRTLSNGLFTFVKKAVHQWNCINSVDEIWSDIVFIKHSIQFDLHETYFYFSVSSVECNRISY